MPWSKRVCFRSSLLTCSSKRCVAGLEWWRSGQLRPSVQPVRAAMRHWLSWVFAYVPGANLILRARSTTLPCGFAWTVLTTVFPSRGSATAAGTSVRDPSYSVTRHVYNGGGTTTRSSCDFRRAPAWAVDLSARHHRPGDARHLVGQRHGRQPDGSALQHTPQPCARRAVPMRCAEHH